LLFETHDVFGQDDLLFAPLFAPLFTPVNAGMLKQGLHDVEGALRIGFLCLHARMIYAQRPVQKGVAPFLVGIHGIGACIQQHTADSDGPVVIGKSTINIIEEGSASHEMYQR